MTDLLTLAREALEDDKRATAGPWCVSKDWTYEVVVGEEVVGKFPREQNASLIANARTREPVLARGVLALTEEVERLKTQLAEATNLDDRDAEVIRLGRENERLRTALKGLVGSGARAENWNAAEIAILTALNLPLSGDEEDK